MGVMRFLVHPAESTDSWPELGEAYVTGIDGRVYPTRVELANGVLSCRRQQPDSGKLNVSCPVEGFGRPNVTTSSLREREDPYLLVVELARGKLTRVRDQLGAWEVAGMATPPEFAEPYQLAHRTFGRAARLQEQPEEAVRLAFESLSHSFRAADVLTQSYTAQRLAVRRRRSARLPASLGCRMSRETPGDAWNEGLNRAFNAVIVPIEWRHVEADEGQYEWDRFDAATAWCEERRLLTCGGPLLDLSPGGLPTWLEPWSADLYNLQSFVSDFVETAITRYLGRIRLWEVLTGGNVGGGVQLAEEQRLTLVAKSLEIARQVDDDVQLVIRVSQPWGEYQRGGQHRLSPLQFVDALSRSGVGLSAVNLEIAMGYAEGGSRTRDLLDVSQLIDRWSLLGLPLYVTLACPSTTSTEPATGLATETAPGTWMQPWSEDAQAAWIDRYLPLLMAKQTVVGIFWAHDDDTARHRFPHAGLLGEGGHRKPALDRVQHYNAEYWRTDG